MHLAINGLTPGADGIVDCAVAERHETSAGVDVTLTPVTSHCLACGAVFQLEPGAHEIYCSKCRPQTSGARPGHANSVGELAWLDHRNYTSGGHFDGTHK